MTEDDLFLCDSRGMDEPTQDTTGAELLLLEPEIVAWLGDYRQPDEAPDDDEPLQAA
jgi:hypothetical protein